MNTLTNLGITSTNRLLASSMGHAVDSLLNLRASGSGGNCKFYYNAGAGGSVLRVLTKSIVGGVVSDIANVASNHFNKLFNKKNVEHNSDWIKSENRKLNKETKQYGKIKVYKLGTSPADTVESHVFAVDDWGHVCYDALMLAIDVDNDVTITQNVIHSVKTGVEKTALGTYRDVYKQEAINAQTICNNIVWYDTTALINVSSDKNLVSTKVVGRDYSRKELISNGDIKFSVSGQITSGRPDVYPTEEVAKFLKVMKYKGIVRVNNQILDQFGVEYIVITDFNLSSKEGHKSVQQYSFTAIGLQPAKEIAITEDTVTYNPPQTMVTNTDSPWVAMFKGQLEGLKGLAKDMVSDGLSSSTGLLDQVLDNNLH